MDETSLSAEENAPPSLERIVEAMLFIGGAPLSAARACETLAVLLEGTDERPGDRRAELGHAAWLVFERAVGGRGRGPRDFADGVGAQAGAGQDDDEQAIQFAAAVLEAVTGEPVGPPPKEKAGPAKDPAAVALGRKGGLKGGPARAKKLGKKKLKKIGKAMAEARWKKAKTK